jgi:hypothetical protein
VAAGPVFVAVAGGQVLTRGGFDLNRHPLSLLSLGDLGWIQITNFVVAGLLALAGAVGMRRTLRGGRGGAWGPALVAVHGTALVVAGVHVTDPSMGYPVGAPDGPPETLSWHAIVHGVAAPVAFVSLTAACLVFAHRFVTLGQRGWAAFCALAALAVVVVTAWPDFDTISVRLAIGSTLTFGWLSLVAARLITGTSRSIG